MDYLCALSDIPDPGGKSFVLEQDGPPLKVLVIRRGGQVFGWVNSCPHIHRPLNWGDTPFLDLFETSIICANHFALFEMDSGLCTRGPCIGKKLTPFPVRVIDGAVWRA